MIGKFVSSFSNEIQKYNPQALDAIGALPVSEKTILGNYVMDKSEQPLLLDRVSNGTSTQTYSTGNGLVTMTAPANGDYAVCQSKYWHPYYAGKPQRIEITFDNMSNTNYNIVVAKNGTLISTPRASWNVDSLDGNGASGVTLDFDNFTVMVIDFLYLGGTAVRFGFKVSDEFYWAHIERHSNVVPGTIVQTPNQPVRWEIRNTGGTTTKRVGYYSSTFAAPYNSGLDGFYLESTGTDTTLNQICAAVSSEGSKNIVGQNGSTPFDILRVNANDPGITYLLNAIRIDSSAPRGTTLIDFDYSYLSTTNDDVVISIVLNPTIAGSLTWASVDSTSNFQYAIGDTVSANSTTTVTNGKTLSRIYSSSANRQTLSTKINTALTVGRSISGTSDIIALCVTPLSSGTNTDAYGIINFIEY